MTTAYIYKLRFQDNTVPTLSKDFSFILCHTLPVLLYCNRYCYNYKVSKYSVNLASHFLFTEKRPGCLVWLHFFLT